MLFAEGSFATETAAWVTAGGSGSIAMAAGFVIRWLLLTHLPAKDAQLKLLLDEKDKLVASIYREQREQIDIVVSKHVEAQKELRADYKESLQVVMSHCTEEMKGFGATMTALAAAVNQLELRERDNVTSSRRGQPAVDQGSHP